MRKINAQGAEIYSEDVFWVLFDYEVTRSQRYPSALSLLQVEATPSAEGGYLARAGTSVFNSALNSHLRAADIVTGSNWRYRILLPTTDEHGCRAVCERLLSIFRNRFDSKEGESIMFSVNIGMASHTGGAMLTKADLLDHAEKALHKAQQKGPNTYVSYSDL